MLASAQASRTEALMTQLAHKFSPYSVKYGPLNLTPYSEGNDLFIEHYGRFTSRLHVDEETGHMQYYPMPGEDIIDHYYNGIFTRGEKDPLPSEEFRPEIIEEVKAVNQYARDVGQFTGNFSVHDIGCGFGAYPWAWQQLGHMASGNEANRRWVKEANPYCQNRLFSEPLNDVLSNLGYKPDYFFTCHVFEHLADPLAMMQIVSNHMSDSSVLTIRVPNNQCFRVLCAGRRTGKDYLNDSGGAGFPMHLHFFTAKSMDAMLRHVGLETIAAKTGTFDEPQVVADDPTWPQQIVHNMLGGELWISACKPTNKTAKRMPNIDTFIEQAFQQFTYLRQKQAEYGMGVA